ncbi:SRPBCC family protein [Actinokineospora sp. UTMC 2448]|uniref:SRPBCC family protein n=1 Tax=Actinokineospora sp. UTMC 2448 TaxID=2268449 RepID=UPI00220C4689|nr:SRPBCC family protein [Actinokineospora sp. UTMC 2448]UVS81617.1 Polyketide cyclase / dehydrase and lipid transport [Actinokineospora sp. UTMC 2448]
MRQVSATRVINAAPGVIFDLLADPAKHPVIDGSGTVVAAVGEEGRRLKLGDRFGMDMKMGLPYKIRNTVVEFEEDRLIAWRHFYGHRWRWQLKDLGDGRTEVTETFDWSTARIGLLLEWVRFPGKNLKSIRATLERLDKMFPAPA